MGRGRRSRERRAEGSARRWRAPALLPLSLLALPLLWLFGGSRGASIEAGYGWLDPEAVEFELPEDRTDPRWRTALKQSIRDFGPVLLDDGARIDALRQRLEALSFVAETDDPRVVWPAGVEFPLRIRRPVACVLVGERYLAVDADGVLLAGDFLLPPRFGPGHLPVLGPLDDGRFDRSSPGEVLALEADLDALSIAESMWEHLPDAALARLGPVRIDAAGARATTVERPGAILFLEGRRSVVFGRSPRQEAIGSLPVAAKWAHLAAALAELDRRDWRETDVRFDERTHAWRDGAGPADAASGDGGR